MPNILKICGSWWGSVLENVVMITINGESGFIFLNVSVYIAGGATADETVFL